MRRLPARLHAHVAAEPERGTTMIELVVGMVLMTICGSIFTGAMVSLTRTSNATQAITDAASQNNRAFQTLDRTVRYASAISVPGQGTSAAKNWYVELRDTTNGSEECTQLRVDTASRQLQSRTWKVTESPPPTWTPLASGITNGNAAVGSDKQPFPVPQVPAEGSSVNRQRLGFYLESTSGPANQRSTSVSSFTLTALNSTSATATGTICTQGGRP